MKHKELNEAELLKVTGGNSEGKKTTKCGSHVTVSKCEKDPDCRVVYSKTGKKCKKAY